MSEAIDRYISVKARKRAERDRTYEIRRQHALEHGTTIKSLVCPLCGLSRPLDSHRGRNTFIIYDQNRPLIQTRKGGGRIIIEDRGRGVGFFLVEEESFTLDEMQEHYPEVYENLRESVEHLAELLELFEEEEEEE